MSEVLYGAIPGNPTPNKRPLLEGPEDTTLHARLEAAGKLRSAQEAWLERRGLLRDTLRLRMTREEFDEFKGAGVHDDGSVDLADRYAAMTRYGILDEQNDQQYRPYVLVEVAGSNTPDQLGEPKLVAVTEADFGVEIEPGQMASDFQNAISDSEDPPVPGSSGGNVVLVDEAVFDAAYDKAERQLQGLARRIVGGATENPLRTNNGLIWVRAGTVGPDQERAYVGTWLPYTSAVRLTKGFGRKYEVLCIVSGEEAEFGPGNDKAGMTEIVNPKVVLTIDNASKTEHEPGILEELQKVYQELYDDIPYFTLTPRQREDRDTLFNSLSKLIAEVVSSNRDHAEDRGTRAQDEPLSRAISPED